MAHKYFDRNGATAGFGTLTGAWDTTTASWSDSSAGTATPTAFTFTDADTAQFGATGTSAVAGTATISTGVTVNLNKIIVQNLSALQTVAASGTGKLVMAGTSPTIDVQNTGSLRISAPIDGTKGFTLTKSVGTGYELVELTNANNPITTTNGPINVATALLVVDPTTASFNFGSARDFQLTGGWRLGDFTSAQTIASGTTFAGTGCLETFGNGTNLVTLPAGALVGLTGTNEPAITYLAGLFNAVSGLALYITSTTTAARNNLVDVYDLPYRVTYQSERTVATTITGRLRYIGPGATFANTRIDLLARGTPSTSATLVQSIYANCSDANPLVIGGGIKRFGNTQVQVFELRGTSTAENEISGNIDETNGVTSLGALGITKEDAGKWVLSGNNNHTGVTTVNNGTLAAASTTALGTDGAVTVANTGQLMLQGGVTVNKASAAFTIHANNPIVSIGDNTIQTAGILLGGTTTFEVTTGNKLTIANTQAIDDAGSTFGITKTGAGELALANFANTYDGTVSVQAGTLTVTTLNNSGVAGVLGRSTSPLELLATLRFAGSSTASSNRALLLQGATPTLEATGTAAVTYSGTVTQTSEARQLVLKGTSTAANALASALANNSFATGIQKTGTGTWRMTGAMSYTGATDVDQGTLRVERPDGNTMASTVTVDAGAFLELATDTMASSGATAGRVLGTGNVVVNGTVRTRGGTTQKGQVRYGGNLTFGSGSSLHIGAAA